VKRIDDQLTVWEGIPRGMVAMFIVDDCLLFACFEPVVHISILALRAAAGKSDKWQMNCVKTNIRQINKIEYLTYNDI